MVSKANLFSEAISCCPLYLLLFKEKSKRMPFPSGLGIKLKKKLRIFESLFQFHQKAQEINQNHLLCH